MKHRSAWKKMALVGLVVGVVGLWNLSRLNFSAFTIQAFVNSDDSASYLASMVSGQIPPRFDSYANNGFGDASFTFQYPFKIWIGIPTELLRLSGNAARSMQLIAMIVIFFWGMQKIEEFFKLRKLTFANAAVVLLVIVALELIISDLAAMLMIMPWLVWAAARFVKSRLTHVDRLWPRVISKEGLLLVSVIFVGLLTSSGMFAVSLGLVLGVLATGTKSAVKPLILCLLWALANTAWFWLPQYAERAEVITDPYSGNFITQSFDAQKANAIFDDYPNQKVISPNAAVKIIPNHIAWQKNSFTAIVPEKSLLIQKTMYFPGWRVKANDQPVTLENPTDYAGLVAYQLEAGTHAVKSQMTQRSGPRIVGNCVSIVGIAIWAWFLRKAIKPKSSGKHALQKFFHTRLSCKESLVRITKKFLPPRSR